MLSRFFTIFLVFGMLMGLSQRALCNDSLISLLDSTVVDEAQFELRLKIAREMGNTDIRKALGYAREALEYAEQLNNRSFIARARLAIGEFYDYLGVQQEAIEHLMEALEIFEELDEPRKEARVLMLIGNAYWYLNQFESALKYYTHASVQGEMANDTSLIISVMNAIGSVYGNTGKMDSAMVLFREANSLARQIGNQYQVILTYFNMGDLNLYAGEIDDALGIFHDLEQNYDLEKYSSNRLVNLYNSMTQAFIRKGDVKWAKRYSEKTRQALSTHARLLETRDYYNNLYQIDTMEHNTRLALDHYYSYTTLNDSLNNAGFKERLANLEVYFDLRSKEGEIERLTLDNQLKDLQISRRKIINYGSGAGILLLFTIIFLVVRSTRKTRQKNVLLEEANQKILAQSKAMQEKNNELGSVIDELKATQQHLVQSEKMASLGTLTAGIAHEINNPLNFISGGLSIIEEICRESLGTEERNIEERRSRALKMAFEGLERATGIVKALMTFSRKGPSKKMDTDLNEIIDNTLLFLNSKITKDIEVRKDYRLTVPVPVYPEKMHQVIMNIIDNAIHAVKNLRGSEKLIIISTSSQDGKAILTIANNGPSINEAILNQLFDPFFTTKDPGEGTGLGLSICYSLISDHKGSIRAENQKGRVAFIIEIPA